MNKWIYWIFPIFWMGVIFYASSQPYQDQDLKPFLSNSIDLSFLTRYLEWVQFTYHQSEVSVHSLGINGFVEFFIRKGAHVTVFLVLMLLVYLAITKTFKFHPIKISLVITVLYAIFDEIHQGFTPNRTPYIGDVFLDTFGGIIGVILIVSTLRLINR